ncbi:MAG: ABC transporter ATP-binding protein [Lachnospiraceae bacterium]|nr:ABC transporter ATP-binding protein [Lachnospiraceae bacterium]
MSNSMIVVENMSFAYGKDNVLTDVNFIIEKREYVGVIGANGAGKSTLMRLILGQLTPSTGKIEVNAQCIGYVPQVGFRTVNNFPANVEEIVMTGLHSDIGMFHFPKKEHREKVRDVLGMVGMAQYRKRMLSELSGGQQQRVLIARALVQNPDLLVLDEPLTGIDKEAGELLYQLLAKLNEECGITIVMVTHNMEQVARYTGRFYHVSNGNVHLDKSSVLCDEVLLDKMMKSKPKRYGSKTYKTKKVDVPKKETPYDASYKGKKEKHSKENNSDVSDKGDTRSEASSSQLGGDASC